MHDTHHFLETLALVLCAAALTTVVFQWLRQPVVLGYLLAGMLIGPHIPVAPTADSAVVHTLAELGVILLMFSLGIEFSLKKLFRVGPTALFVAVVQCSVMIWLGYLAGQAFGWSRLASLYAGGVIAISSTTIIVKAFEEQRIKGGFTQVVFGVLIVEDLIAILLITILTALSTGKSLTAVDLGMTAGRLAMFLVVLFVVGLLTVPRLMRAVVRLDRPETTVVASVGLAFGFALLAAMYGYSVALGAFIAGSLVAESGVESKIEHLVQPVRDMFAAIFFVSVGMLINPGDIAAHWLLVLVFLVLVVVGKVVSVTLSAVLTGQSIQTSVRCGMSLAQIGEFSFIIAGLGLTTQATDKVLYSIAVAVSALTTLLTPWLIRAAEPAAAMIDAKLPRPLQTFVAVYGTWLEQLRNRTAGGASFRLQRLFQWLIVDAMLLTAIVIGAATQMDRLTALVQTHVNVMPRLAQLIVVIAAVFVSSPFWIGMVRVARYLGFEIASRVFPGGKPGAVDLAAAPRRLLVVTMQLAIVVFVGAPVLAITQPFLPPWEGAGVIFALLALLAYLFWRGATNFQGHTRAAAQAIAESLARQTSEGRQTNSLDPLEKANDLLAGLGSPVSVLIGPNSPVIGKTLSEIRLRGTTGATVLAIQHAGSSVLVPSGQERLAAGDVLAVAGTSEAVEAAKSMLTGGG
ncbi:MAG: cation:proton antiporter [Planctomycetia bacterium]|nr:cation:proton antiporter [Planctomycetia bacterium]